MHKPSAPQGLTMKGELFVRSCFCFSPS